MAVKPAVDPKWSTTNNPSDNIEPTASLKNGGVPAGGVWGREFLNWQFFAISQWIDWVRSSALDKDNNLSDLTNVSTARTNLGLNNAAVTLGANAATATRLQTARTIGGVSFDGTANINLPGVNTAGNQNTSGNAATVTNGVYTTGNQTIGGLKTFSSSPLISTVGFSGLSAINKDYLEEWATYNGVVGIASIKAAGTLPVIRGSAIQSISRISTGVYRVVLFPSFANHLTTTGKSVSYTALVASPYYVARTSPQDDLNSYCDFDVWSLAGGGTRRDSDIVVTVCVV